jgi:hypothetical protein
LPIFDCRFPVKARRSAAVGGSKPAGCFPANRRWAIANRQFSIGNRLVALGVLALISPSVAGARKKKKPLPPTLADQVNSLARQLYGVPFDESQPLTDQIQKLVLDHMSQWLAAHPPTAQSLEPAAASPYDVQVRRELESLFALLRYPIYAIAAAFAQPWGKQELVGAGYTLGWSDYDRANVVALFEASGASVEPLAITHFVPDTDLHYAFFAPPPAAADQFWFLVYGTRLGKSHPRLSAVLYSFDGKALNALWQIRDAYDGQISVAGERVLINYMKESEFIDAVTNHTEAPRHQAAYHVGTNGLELEYDR